MRSDGLDISKSKTRLSSVTISIRFAPHERFVVLPIQIAFESSPEEILCRDYDECMLINFLSVDLEIFLICLFKEPKVYEIDREKDWIRRAEVQLCFLKCNC